AHAAVAYGAARLDTPRGLPHLSDGGHRRNHQSLRRGSRARRLLCGYICGRCLSRIQRKKAITCVFYSPSQAAMVTLNRLSQSHARRLVPDILSLLPDAMPCCLRYKPLVLRLFPPGNWKAAYQSASHCGLSIWSAKTETCAMVLRIGWHAVVPQTSLPYAP